MATVNLIQIKRSSSTDAPTLLANGELAYSFTDASNSLFVGDPRNATPGTPLRIGGGRYGFLQNATLASGEGGTLSANAVVITNANSFIDSIKSNQLIVGTDGATTPAITSITADDTLATVSNSSLVTSYAIKQFVTDRVGSGVSAGGANGEILVYNTDTLSFANVAVTGDIEIAVDGTTSIVANSIVNADIADDAAIDSSKIDFSGTGVGDGDIASDADIARSKLAAGTADYVIINDGTGRLSEEQFLSPSRGGAGLDASAAANGALLIGNNTGFTLTTLTATTNEIEITNTQGAIQIGLPDDVTITANLTSNNATISNDLTVQGNLSVEGTLTTIDTVNLVVEDPLLKLAKNQSSANASGDTVDIGLYGAYANATNTLYSGFFRDTGDGYWKLFQDLTAEPTTTVDTTDGSYVQGTLSAALVSNNVTITGGSITDITDIAVADGGTGRSSFTNNGILFGNTSGALSVTSAGANGSVLQVVADVPQFGTLDGGTF